MASTFANPIRCTFLLFTFITSASSNFNFSGELNFSSTALLTFKLSKPLIKEERIYMCSGMNLFAFHSNGLIDWTLPLVYFCDSDVAPIPGGSEKIYLIAENRILKVNIHKSGASQPSSEVFLGPEKGQEETMAGIVGIAVSTWTSTVFVNIQNTGLFAYTTNGQLLWNIRPVITLSDYRLSCREGNQDCSFSSVPVIDHCEGSIYMSNTAGEIYSLSMRASYINWVQNLSSLDKVFSITCGNNGRLYVTFPTKALVVALDVTMGNILWQAKIGPLSSAASAPVVDSNGWISIGSLDGYLYTVSTDGDVHKFTKVSTKEQVIQVGPVSDCSGYAVYISQTMVEGKDDHGFGEHVTVVKPKGAVFTLVVPSTGAMYWSESYPNDFSSSLSRSDLQHFLVDEEILLAFVAASRTGNPLACRKKYEKLVSSCALAKPNRNAYTGNELQILFYLIYESIMIGILAVLARYCCMFWRKRKLKGQGLGAFLEKRRSLWMKKRAFDRTITELERKAAEDALANEVIEEIRKLIRERDGIRRKLSTTYSLGRDETPSVSSSRSILPLSSKSRSYSFQTPKKESFTLFHTLSSDTNSSSRETSSSSDNESDRKLKSADKGKKPSSGFYLEDYHGRSTQSQAETASSRGYLNPLYLEKKSAKESNEGGEVMESTERFRRTTSLKRRTTLSSTS